MKIIIIFLTAVLFISTDLSFAQNYWTGLNGPFGGNVLEVNKGNNGNMVILRGEGVYNSADNGETWSAIPQGMVNTNLSMTVSPSGIIYTGKSTGGLWWTGNNGQSWSFNPISVAPHSGLWASIYLVKVSPAGQVYINNHVSFNGGNNFTAFSYNGTNLLTSDYAFNSSGHVYSATTNGIYYSTNNASSWTNINGNLPSLSSSGILTDNNTLITAIHGSGIFKTSDNGNVWTEINNGINDLNIIKIYKDNSGNYFAGTSTGKVFRSSDQGNSWNHIFISSSANRINSIYSEGNNVVVTSSFGIFFSDNSGITWSERNNNLNIPIINTIIFPGENQIMAASGTGVQFSDDNGQSWENRSTDLPGMYVNSLLKTDNNEVLASVRNSGIYRTSDNGITWNNSGTGIPEAYQSADILISPEGYIFAGVNTIEFPDTLKIFHSSDNGNTWSKIFQPETNDFNTLEIDASGNLYLFKLQSFKTALLRSSDNGNTWTEIDLSEFFFVSEFTSSQNNLYISVSGNIYKSIDMGINWTEIPRGGWQTSSLNALSVNKRGDIFVSAGQDIYLSMNDGVSWIDAGSGITNNAYINNFVFDNLNYIYGFGYYYGIFKSVQPTITGISNNFSNSEIPDSYSLSQNFPNPFNPSTVINYHIPVSGKVKLKVTDISGKEVALLVNEFQTKGDYKAEFNSDNNNISLSSGIYFYTLETAEFISTRKMILLK